MSRSSKLNQLLRKSNRVSSPAELTTTHYYVFVAAPYCAHFIGSGVTYCIRSSHLRYSLQFIRRLRLRFRVRSPHFFPLQHRVRRKDISGDKAEGACDITNVYLNAPCQEKIWFVGRLRDREGPGQSTYHEMRLIWPDELLGGLARKTSGALGIDEFQID